MTRIDLHAHVVSDAYLDALRGPDGSRPPLPPATLEGLQAMMDRHAIDAAVISPGPPGVFFGDQGRANELARMLNEENAAIVRDAPARFAALATLPLPSVDAALAEVAYALDVLEMDGVALLSQVAGTYLGDPAWDPLFAELQARGAFVFVHPAMPPYAPPAPQPVWLYELPFETTRAIATLIYNGTFERFPDVRMQFSHLGGAAPFLAHRLASLSAREPALADAAPAGALEYLRRQFYDTGLSNHELALRTTLDVTSLDHIVFGTDWPYAALPPDGGDPAPELAFLGEDRAAVDAANARALVPRLVDAVSRRDPRP